MFGSETLETKFNEMYNNIKKTIEAKDYKLALRLIEEAFEVCKKIYGESINYEKREFWKNNLISLKKLYADCEEKVGIVYVKPKPIPTKPKVIKEKEEDSEMEKDINYIVNDIDVSQFLIEDSNDNVTFNDVCGMENEKQIIINEFFISEEKRKFREEYLKLKNNNFILLYGVPGTGKTYFAKAISNELKLRNSDIDVPFFAIQSSRVKDCKVGVSEKNIQAIFEFCEQFERAVLFFDEFDSLVPDRKIDTGDPTDKTNVTTFLQMIDGFKSNKGILVIGATNHPYLIDSAVISRVNKEIEIPLPDKETIVRMLNMKIRNLISKEVDLEVLSNKLIGYSSRDIDHLVNYLKEELDKLFEENVEYSELKITNQMIEKALKVIKPRVKVSDLRRIEEYKLKGE